jgi:hypothetical protein
VSGRAECSGVNRGIGDLHRTQKRMLESSYSNPHLKQIIAEPPLSPLPISFLDGGADPFQCRQS